MTPLTRRDALLLTAAAAAVSSTVQSAEAQAQPADKPPDDLLEVPRGTVNGSSIPITVKIPLSKAKPVGENKLKQFDIAVSLQNPNKDEKKEVFTAKFEDKAVPADPDSDIALMTRLKIASDPWPAPGADAQAQTTPATPKPFPTKLVAQITVKYTKEQKDAVFTATQSLTVQPDDCPVANVSLLRLALQPPTVAKGKAVIVKAVAPPVAAVDAGAAPPASGSKPKPPRPLKSIDCQLTPPTKTSGPPAAAAPAAPPPVSSFNMTTNGSYLADDAFVSFNIYPDGDATLKMQWAYPNGSDPDLVVSAQAYVSTKA
jgi:hypothetical protein